MTASLPKTVVVVPCYNEAARLSMDDFSSFLDSHAGVDFCFVNDGSTDATADVLDALVARHAARVSVETHKRNEGKAAAVRTGMRGATRRDGIAWVGYWDADLATPLDEIPRFFDYRQDYPHAQFLAGARVYTLGTDIERYVLRHYLGRVFATAASMTLRMAVYDTQCGAKLIAADVARTVFNEPFLSRWFFDVELFARVRQVLGADAPGRSMIEVPLRKWTDKSGSKIRFRHYFVAGYEMLRIGWRYTKWRRPK